MVELTFIARGKERMGCAGEAGLAVGDQIRQLMGGLTLAYGDQIRLKFLDPDEDPTVENHPFFKDLPYKDESLPALYIDRQLKFQKGIPLMALKSVLDGLGLTPAEFPGLE